MCALKIKASHLNKRGHRWKNTQRKLIYCKLNYSWVAKNKEAFQKSPSFSFSFPQPHLHSWHLRVKGMGVLHSPSQPLWSALLSLNFSLLHCWPLPWLQSFRDSLLLPGLSMATAPVGNAPLLQPGAFPGLQGASLLMESLQGCRGPLMKHLLFSCSSPVLLFLPWLHPPLSVPALALSEIWFSHSTRSLTEWLGCVLLWGQWTFKDHLKHLPCLGCSSLTPFNLTSNVSGRRASTTCLCDLFQCLTTHYSISSLHPV